MKLHRGLLSISDFAAYCGSTRQTMQYYDYIGLLDPFQVGSQGYRYYHPLQGHEVRLIHSLQQSGCSLDEVKEILYSSDIDSLQDRLQAKQQALEEEIRQIRREQIYLTRFRQFLSLVETFSLDAPKLLTLNKPMYLHEMPFSDPCELYSEYYYQMLLRYSSFCRANSATIQHYPYVFYVDPEEIRTQLRLCKIVCMPEDTSTPDAGSFTAPAGQYLAIRCQPDDRNRFDHRKQVYEKLFQFMDAHDLKPLGGSLELPFCLPPVLRQKGYRFEVVFIMPVVPADQEAPGGEAE